MALNDTDSEKLNTLERNPNRNPTEEETSQRDSGTNDQTKNQ